MPLGVAMNFLSSPAAPISAAACGLAGSAVLVWAAWHSLDLRKSLIEGDLVENGDSELAKGARRLKRVLNEEQKASLNHERWAYVIGTSLLAIGFLITLLRELLVPSAT